MSIYTDVSTVQWSQHRACDSVVAGSSNGHHTGAVKSHLHPFAYAGHSGLVVVYHATGRACIMTVIAIHILGHGLLHLSCSA